MMAERGLPVDHTTVYHRVQHYTPILEKRSRSKLKPTNNSWRVDETYIKVKGAWMYLYLAVDSAGNTVEFMLSPNRDAQAAKRFFRKALRARHTTPPRVINVGRNPAYPKAVGNLKKKGALPQGCKLRPIKYLNNLIEQVHRFIKRRVNPGMGFWSFDTAWRTLQGYEAMHQLGKGQVKGTSRGDIHGQTRCLTPRLLLCFSTPLFGLVKVVATLPIKVYSSRVEARQSIFEYVEVWYNRQRRHSALDYVSPDSFESAHYRNINESIVSG
ncbi:MAG: IS6 family transposase [Chloroflexia bacterium]